MRILSGFQRFILLICSVAALALAGWTIIHPRPLPWLLTTNHILIAIFLVLVAIFFMSWRKQ